MSSLAQPRITLQDYLSMEDTSGSLHEFLDGEIFEMEAASFRHQQIGVQFLGAIRPAIKANGCEIHFQGTRVATSNKGLYTYPDMVIFCGQPKFWDADPNALSNPKALVEILSPRTMDYDRGTKFQMYREIASLEEYVAIHQDSPFVEHHVKQPDGSWRIRDLHGLGATLQMESVAVEVAFAIFYDGIEFDAT